MAEVLALLRRVDAHAHLEFSPPCLESPSRVHADLARRRRGRSPSISNISWPVRPRDAAFCAVAELQRRTPMPIRFERWMRSKLSAITARTPSSTCPWRPSRARSRCRTPSGEDRPAGVLRFCTASLRRRSTPAHRRQVQRDAALDAGHQQVAQADVGEGAAHHHLVVAAARAVRVEVLRLHALLDEVTCRRAGLARCCRQARCGRSSPNRRAARARARRVTSRSGGGCMRHASK